MRDLWDAEHARWDRTARIAETGLAPTADASANERRLHEVSVCGVLRDPHNELNRLIAEEYGWPWPMEAGEILARLLALHDEPVEEEQRGRVRWLRPDYQITGFGDKVESGLTLDVLPDQDDDELPDDLPDWPADPVEQADRRFKGAVPAEVEKHFEALEVLGVVTEVKEGKWRVRCGAGVGSS